MSVPVKQDDLMSSDRPDANTNDPIMGGPGTTSQCYFIFRREDAANRIPPPELEPLLQSSQALDESYRRTPTLEELLELWQVIENSETQPGAAPDDTPTAQDMNRLKLAVLQPITALFCQRFEQSRQREDLDMTIQFQTRGLQLTLGTDLEGAEWQGGLGVSYQYRFNQLGNLEDLGKAIDFTEQALLHTPFNHPDKAQRLNNLGVSYQSRFQHLGRLEDLDKSVGCKEQAVTLTPDGHPDKPAWLSNLGVSYQLLFEHLGRLEDLDKSVGCKEQAVTLTPDGHPDKPACLNNLGISYQLLFEHLGRLEDLDKSVGCFEQAVTLTPDDHPDKPACLNNLGVSYQLLFERLGRLEDLDKSVGCKEQAVTLTPDGHPDKPGCLNNLGVSYQLLFQCLGRLEDLDKSVGCKGQAVTLTPDGHPDKPRWLNNLGNSYQLLFEHLGRLEDLDKSVGCKEQAVTLTPDGHPDKPACLNNLGVSYQWLFEHLGRLEDLDKSVGCQEQAVTLTPDGHPDKPGGLNNLGASYLQLYRHLGRLEYANYAAGCFRCAELLTPDGHPQKSTLLNSLGKFHWDMFNHSKLPEHLSDAIHFHKASACSLTGSAMLRLESSHQWAQLSHLSNIPSLDAYTHCMTLLPLVVWLGTPTHERYRYLANDIGRMVTEAAAVAISSQRYDLAIEWLEQGRSVVWGQTMQLRTPYDDLHAIQPELAKELQDVSYQLEWLSTSQPVEPASDHTRASSHEISWKHRRLAERREELLTSARLLPEFDDFLRPPKTSKLVKLVPGGITVIVNVHRFRCDALAIQASTQAITHVPLVDFSVKQAEDAREDLASCLGGRGSHRGFKKGDIRRQPTIKAVLAMLWYDVVKPVLGQLGITEILPADELPHITWCTTGPLSFLPLHAAGDYDSPSTVLSNLAISSYTPNISSLGERTSSPSLFSGILAVGHASSVRNLNELPGTKDELDQVQIHAGHLPFTRLDEENACKDAVMKAMQNHSWVHFACHGSQDSMDPMKSALQLHDEGLDLATIARNPVKNAQLAFLSACQTATGDSVLPDESIHLAAGLLMAGYPTVIATMWSINDRDAPLVADKVYECLLEGGSPDSGKAALALHKAVACLRDTIGVNEFARWVPFIHIGR